MTTSFLVNLLVAFLVLNQEFTVNRKPRAIVIDIIGYMAGSTATHTNGQMDGAHIAETCTRQAADVHTIYRAIIGQLSSNHGPCRGSRCTLPAT